MYTPNSRVDMNKDAFDLQSIHGMTKDTEQNINMGDFKGRKESGYVKNFNIQKWLDDYNHIGAKNYDFKHVKDRIAEICEHKDGSRVIQEHIDIAVDTQIAFIFL